MKPDILRFLIVNDLILLARKRSSHSNREVIQWLLQALIRKLAISVILL